MASEPRIWRRLVPSEALHERDAACRFEWPLGEAPLPAFVLRIDGQPRAWLNRCAHVPVELDGTPGRFLDDAGRVIVCATHGAVYDPVSGRCLRGPCRGKSLHPVPCREHDGWIEVADSASS
jgi:nitrite reductase/ring-hydroxylating ferredoxin subunit